MQDHRALYIIALALLIYGCGTGSSELQHNMPPVEFLPETCSFTAFTQIPYAQDGSPYHVMDAYIPDGAGPFPALLFIHGGGWTTGDRSEFQGMAEFYARRGLAGFTVEYRTAAPGLPSWPKVLHDVLLAAEHICQNATLYRIDSQRIGAVGFSAGAHLASLLGTLSGSEPFLEGVTLMSGRLRLIVDYAGPTDLEFIGRNGTRTPGYARIIDLIRILIGTDYETDPTSWREASPATYITENDPVFVIAHGTADDIVPIAISRTFSLQLEEKGVETHLVVVDQAGHGFNEQQNLSVRRVLEPLLWNLLLQDQER